VSAETKWNSMEKFEVFIIKNIQFILQANHSLFLN
jgi:hypothetical protein